MLLTNTVPAVFTVELAEKVLERIRPIIVSVIQAYVETADLCVVVGNVKGQVLGVSCFGNAALHKKIACACLYLTAEESMPIGYLRREHAELATCAGMPVCDGESYIDGGIIVAASGGGSSRSIEAITMMVTGFVRAAIQEAAVELRENSNGATFIR
jgi:hypothetical protein